MALSANAAASYIPMADTHCLLLHSCCFIPTQILIQILQVYIQKFGWHWKASLWWIIPLSAMHSLFPYYLAPLNLWSPLLTPAPSHIPACRFCPQQQKALVSCLYFNEDLRQFPWHYCYKEAHCYPGINHPNAITWSSLLSAHCTIPQALTLLLHSSFQTGNCLPGWFSSKMQQKQWHYNLPPFILSAASCPKTLLLLSSYVFIRLPLSLILLLLDPHLKKTFSPEWPCSFHICFLLLNWPSSLPSVPILAVLDYYTNFWPL